jgi:hypothetical protein
LLFLNIDDWNDRNSVLKGHSQAVTPNLWELGFPRLRVTEIRALLRDHGQIIPGKASEQVANLRQQWSRIRQNS